MLLLTDFGFAQYLVGDTEAVNNLRGSLLYMAPEILTLQHYNEKADLWSVGVILYGMSLIHELLFFFILNTNIRSMFC